MLQTRLLKRFYSSAFFCLMLAGMVMSQALPGEYLLTSRWRDLFAQYSPLTNPALLTEENYASFRGAFSDIEPGGFKFWEMGLTYPIGLDQSVGFTWLAEDDGNISQYSTDAQGEVVLNGAPTTSSSNLNSFFTGTYAYNIWDGLSIGANVNFAYQSNFSDGASGAKPLIGLGLDLGLTYRAILDPLLGTHLLGLAMQNVIAPGMSSTNILDLSNQNAYSRNLRLSWYSTYWEHRIESGLDFNIKDILANVNEFRLFRLR